MSRLPATRPGWALRGVLALGLLLAVLIALGHSLRRKPASLLTQLDQDTLPADGTSTADLTLRASDGRNLVDSDVSITAVEGGNKGVRFGFSTSEGSDLHVRITSGILPGPVHLAINTKRLRPATVHLTVSPYYEDRFADGTPDFLRLDDPTDRDAFRRWFTLLADYESLLAPDKVAPEIGDCAGLIRFAYRGALHRHDAAWLTEAGLDMLPSLPSVKKYEYPYTPLGAGLFRVTEGAFQPQDIQTGAFAEFADARNLQVHNTHFVSRDVAQARPGDLLFYRRLGQTEPYHSMVFVGRSQLTGDPAELVIYHTGPIGRTRGEIRRVQVQGLLQHPSPEWRPLPGNANFLGVYRWNILREAKP